MSAAAVWGTGGRRFKSGRSDQFATEHIPATEGLLGFGGERLRPSCAVTAG